MMELLPGEIRAALPQLYATEKLGKEAIAIVKYFTPDSNWTWYATEFDGVDTFFGRVEGDEVELGYFSLSELEGVRGSLGVPVEQDEYLRQSRSRKLIYTITEELSSLSRTEVLRS
jgi:hypothetical protein